MIDKYIDRINKDLINKGLTYSELREDILDHVCCMIEEEMDSGKDFESCYAVIISDINNSVLTDLQHKTLLLKDKKFQKMKKITYLLGLTGALLAITGAIFKVMHWPGASITLTVGFLIVVLGFLPLYFIGSYREQAEKPKVIYPLIAYLSLFFVFSGAIFKIMHWPGANWLIRLSIITVLIGFLPLYIVQIFKRTSQSKINPAYIIMLLVGISIVLIMSRVNLSKDAIDRYTELTIQYEKATESIVNEMNNFIEYTPDSLITDEMEKIISLSDALEMQIDEMLSGLLRSVDQEGVSIEKVNKRDYRFGAHSAFIKNGLAEDFLKKSRDYRQFLSSLSNDPPLKNQIGIEMIYADGDWISGWNPSDYAKDPLIINYYKICTFRYAINHAEYIALTSMIQPRRLY